MDAFHLYRGRKIDPLLSGLHMPNRGDGFTVVSIMPPTLPQAGTLALSGCFEEINNSLHRCVSALRSRKIKHSSDTQAFVIDQGGIYLIPGTESDFRIAAAELLRSLAPSPHRTPST
jgi:hypothetical protein